LNGLEIESPRVNQARVFCVKLFMHGLVNFKCIRLFKHYCTLHIKVPAGRLNERALVENKEAFCS